MNNPITAYTIIDRIDPSGGEWTRAERVRELFAKYAELEAANKNLLRDLNAALARVDALEAQRATLIAAGDPKPWKIKEWLAAQINLPPGLDARLKGRPLEGEPIQFSPAPQRSGPASLEGIDGKPQAPHNAEAGED